MYAISASSETIYDIIQRAGGTLPDAYLKASTFTEKRNEIQLSLAKNLKTKLRRNNILLQGGDQVFIASRSQLGTVTGEVNNPGKKLFLKGKRLNYYIKHSGGSH